MTTTTELTPLLKRLKLGAVHPAGWKATNSRQAVVPAAQRSSRNASVPAGAASIQSPFEHQPPMGALQAFQIDRLTWKFLLSDKCERCLLRNIK